MALVLSKVQTCWEDAATVDLIALVSLDYGGDEDMDIGIEITGKTGARSRILKCV